MTRRRLLRDLDSYELTEWQEFFAMEHLGLHDNDRADLRMGIQTSATINAFAKVMSGESPGVEPVDFVPTFHANEYGDSAVNMAPEDFSAMLHSRFRQAG